MSKQVLAYIGLGSNLSNRKDNLEGAIRELEGTEGIRLKRISPFYNTSPVGYTEQPDFLNCVAEIETKLDPYELLRVCMDIEKRLKRVRDIHWGPRTIDLDILLYGNLIMNGTELTIPHPRMTERYFVLKPLSDLAADAIHPVKNRTVGELLEALLIDKNTD